ncbi:mechanosensitive ion channel family protein [Comamonas testosteroni]|uniref:mechanosensitive ion channel family protein n=1 Tax=Comamonas testosteroni TaxID=285 RepID=UPI00265EF723|nr:mechanosensitive ion channel family protein [Comamonas testosteroni]WKL17236.1 mechanosensitive ion channel family protein [Comamonas testosteroni]WQD44254.1 mechanosensitive ion channel family protein [Comamonas testosteroni]
MRRLQMRLPDWMQDWLEILIPGIQIFLIILVAWLINWLIKRIISRAGKAYDLPHELLMPLRGVFRWIIIAAAVLAILERLGMSATVLWTAFTGFATVGAVAFFAAWSVLSNLFCALLIVTVGPFRLGDYIEVLDTAEKPGAKGRVIDLNMLYITLQDDSAPAGMPNLLQIPNSLIFQRVIRRWKGGMPMVTENTPATSQEEACAVAITTPGGSAAASG